MVALNNGEVEDEQSYALEHAADEPDLSVLKRALEDLQGDASNYFQRNEQAWKWWHSIWENQNVDGRKWPEDENVETDSIWPWRGCSDVRVGTIAKVMNWYSTVANHVLHNMKLQAKSTRPFNAQRQSEQATILMNWLVFTHMKEEVLLEWPLACEWRNGFGSSVIETVWETERRIDYVEISMMALQQFANMQNGQNRMLDYFQSAISDPTQETELITFVQMMSPIIDRDKAREIIKDLRELRTAQIPVPYTYVSKPRFTALRTMVDVQFPVYVDNLQKSPWINRIERVTVTELTDRIDMPEYGYDEDFVEEVISHRGYATRPVWANRIALQRGLIGPTNIAYYHDDFDNQIELNHFYRKCLDGGVPTLYETTFHPDCDAWAKHGPYGYKHGKMPYDACRFEKHERPILTSRGIPEIAYTQEIEIKHQRDARINLSDLETRPPMLADQRDVIRFTANFEPGVIMPYSRGTNPSWWPTPKNENRSIEIENATLRDLYERFPLFGEVDPVLKQLYLQEYANDLLMEFSRPIDQAFQLAQEFLPDDEVTRVVGQLSRPFKLSRQDIQGQFEFTMTVDMRELDKDFRKDKREAIMQLIPLDNQGAVDHTDLIRHFMEGMDLTLADTSIRKPGPSSEKEIKDEKEAIRGIIGSGADVELPEGVNHQLRLQIGQQYLQQLLQTNPVVQKKIQENQDILKVLQNRMTFHQRQLAQRENAQIGRMQVSETFSGKAPTPALPPSNEG